MSSFSTKIHINATPEKTWGALGDIGNIYRWNPGVKNSYLTSDTNQGAGTTRFCDLGGGNFLDESVALWEPNQALTMRITNTNLPFKTADIRFRLLAADGGTEVEVSPTYVLKFGPIGKVLDYVYVKNTYEKGMRDLLRGLKAYIEDTDV